MLNVVMLSADVLEMIILSVEMLNVFMLSIDKMNIIILSVMAPLKLKKEKKLGVINTMTQLKIKTIIGFGSTI